MAEYRKALISFIDILGFRQIVDKRSCSEIEQALNIMRKFSDGDDSGEEYSAKVIQFSDSIIRIRPLDSKINEEERYGALFHELDDIGMMQGDLANNNIYIRGGVTVGDISYENGTVFGPGFVRAYDLESKIANYPRIVVDRKILDEITPDSSLLSTHQSFETEKKYLSKQMIVGSDGIHFIDYLSIIIDNIDDTDDIIPFLQGHKDNILSNIKSRSHLDNETGKYLWAAIYHNNFLDGRVKKIKVNKGLWISDKDMPLLKLV